MVTERGNRVVTGWSGNRVVTGWLQGGVVTVTEWRVVTEWW